MAIGIYHGKGKPSSVADFLTPFVEETKTILENGIILENGHILQIQTRCFISDFPVRAFINIPIKNVSTQYIICNKAMA